MAYNKRNKKYDNYAVMRAKVVRDIVKEHYEEGRQDRCKRQAWRTVVMRGIPISERTFWRYMRMTENEKAGERMPGLFDDNYEL